MESTFDFSVMETLIQKAMEDDTGEMSKMINVCTLYRMYQTITVRVTVSLVTYRIVSTRVKTQISEY